MSLNSGLMDPEWGEMERHRVRSRAGRYCIQDGRLCRVFQNGSVRVVQEREALITRVHNKYGHYGIRRTYSLISPFAWWASIWTDVARVVRECPVCDRAKSATNIQPAELSPWPVRGLGYRQHVDLFGPATPSEGFYYGMVVVEAFTKWVEVIPLRGKSAAETAQAFAQVMARFGACAEVVTDHGKEFQGECHELLVQCQIEHVVTAHDRPQSNGQAERTVQTIKMSLRCLVDEKGERWVIELPWTLLGYRCSTQAATRMSPYLLMYAREPVIPPNIMERMRRPIDMDNVEEAVRSLMERSALLATSVPVAFNNLLVAQQQNKLRYAQLRSGGYLPAAANFAVGQFVFLNSPTSGRSALSFGASSTILRVVEARENWRLTLQGRCGATCEEHQANVTLCHLSIEPSLDPEATEIEILPLCRAFEWDGLSTVLDPWSGNGTTRGALAVFPPTALIFRCNYQTLTAPCGGLLWRRVGSRLSSFPRWRLWSGRRDNFSALCVLGPGAGNDGAGVHVIHYLCTRAGLVCDQHAVGSRGVVPGESSAHPHCQQLAAGSFVAEKPVGGDFSECRGSCRSRPLDGRCAVVPQRLTWERPVPQQKYRVWGGGEVVRLERGMSREVVAFEPSRQLSGRDL